MTTTTSTHENQEQTILRRLQSIRMQPNDVQKLLHFSYRQIQYARKLGRIVPAGNRKTGKYAQYTYREVVQWRIVRFLQDLGYSPQVIFGEEVTQKRPNPAKGVLVDIEALLKNRRGRLARFVLWIRPDTALKDPEYAITKTGTLFDLKRREGWRRLSFYNVQLQVLRFMRKRAPKLFQQAA